MFIFFIDLGHALIMPLPPPSSVSAVVRTRA
jgi:hypothetical protein